MLDSRWLAPSALLGVAGIQLLAFAAHLDARAVLIVQTAVAAIPLLLLPVSRRPLRRGVIPAVALMVVLALVLGSGVAGDWHYYEGSASAGRDDVDARMHLELALRRVDGPGFEIPGTRVKLTKYGLVSVFRVTPLMTLANIELRAANFDAAHLRLEEAIAAGNADPREDADIGFLEQVLDGVERKQAEASSAASPD